MADNTQPQRPNDDELALIAQAMQKVIGAITSFHGADCLLTSKVAAAALRKLGYENAVAVAGSAAWRVGEGDGDVVMHAMEMSHQSTGLLKPNSADGVPAGLFHAWVQVNNDIVDFTTACLPAKAHALDAMDGMTTTVDWSPPFLWVDAKTCQSFDEVANGFDVGVFAYRRHAEIEKAVLRPNEEYDPEVPAQAVITVLNSLKAGAVMNVIGLDEHGESQTLEDAARHARLKGFKKI